MKNLLCLAGLLLAALPAKAQVVAIRAGR